MSSTSVGRTVTLKGACECGGDVEVYFYRDPFDRKIYVDHGCCVRCMKGHVFPSEEYGKFVGGLVQDKVEHEVSNYE